MVKVDGSHAQAIVNGVSRIGYMTGGTAARWNDEDIADTLTRKAVAFLENPKAGPPFFRYLVPHDIHEPMAPHPRFRGTRGCGWRGDVIHQRDWTVSEVLGALDRRGLAQMTRVISAPTTAVRSRTPTTTARTLFTPASRPTALCAVSRVRSTKVAIAFRFSSGGRRALRLEERPTR